MKKRRRVLSMLLAAIMLVSLLPGGFAGAADSVSLKYVFSAPAVGLADDSQMTIASGTAADASGKGLSDIDPEISAPWDLLAIRSLHGSRYRTGGIWFRTQTGNVVKGGVQQVGANGLSFMITVPADGLYKPTIKYDHASTGGIVGVYLFDEATATNRNFDMTTQMGIKSVVAGLDPIGTFDTYDALSKLDSFDKAGMLECGAVELKAGNYYLVFAINGINSAIDPATTATICMELCGFSLTETQAEVKVEKVTYDFRKGTYDAGVDVISDYSLTGNWKFNSLEEGLAAKFAGNYKFARYLDYGIQLQSGAGEWIALTLDVPAGGFYIADFKYAMGPSGSIGDIYIAPTSFSSDMWLSDTYYIEAVNFYYDGDFTKNVEAELPMFKLDKGGEYVLVLKSRESALYPTSLTLTSAEITGVDVLFEEDYLRVGATEQVIMKIATSKERSVDVVGGKPSFKSSDERIATVSSDGTIRGVSEGTVTITAETTIYGEKLSGSRTIEVKNISYDHADVNLVEGESFFVGGQKALTASGYFSDGSKIKDKDITVRYESSNEDVVKVEDGTLYAVSEGDAKITTYVIFAGEEKAAERNIKVEAVKLAYITAKTEDNVVSSFDTDGSKIVVTGTNNDGSTADLSDAVYVYESLTPGTVSVDKNGYAHYVSRGEGKVKVSATIGGLPFECECNVIPSSHKTKPTVYTSEMRTAALDNIAKYDWAKKLKKTAVTEADAYLQNLDFIYNHIPGEGIPRANQMALTVSPTEIKFTCPYPSCQVDVREKYHFYGWNVNPVENPWKVQCPECKRLFPSNDFESFYKLGLQPDGTFDREVAMQKNAEIVAAGGKGYLVNELYSDMPEDWLVDDGFGWSMSEGYGTKIRTDKLCPIAYYMHWLWGMNGTNQRSFITKAINTFRDAYLYTGDAKYGRAGAILIDRVADVYPTYEFESTSINYPNAQGGRNAGKIIGCIWEPELAEMFIRAYDAFYPMFDDAQVINYLSAKSTEYGQVNPKTSGDMIRENIENGIVRETFKATKNGKLWGNFGMQQLTIAVAAAALDTYPETGNMLDWLGREERSGTGTYGTYICPIYGTNQSTATNNFGGDMLIKYIADVDRDGFGNEVGVGYNILWVTNGLSIAEVLYRYGAESDLNLFGNPKYVKMYNTFIKETAGDGYTLQFGDSGATASAGLYSTANQTLRAYYMLGDPFLAQSYYYTVGGDLDDVYIDIFTDNDGLRESIEDDVEEYGELKFGSENLTGFGLAMVRGGELIKGAGAGSEHRYDTWMYYGITGGSHGHHDMLHLGIDAYGFNFMPDLGYPEATAYDPNRYQWVMPSISHNTVTVNNVTQNATSGGNPLHFDDAGRVKVIDTEAEGVYTDVNIYRRTAVTIEESAEVAYTVDFFRVKGGDKHTYSFHTQSYMGYTTEDFTFAKQVDENGEYVGSYAGADVPYGKDPNTPPQENSDCVTKYPRGYTWLTNVNRAENLTSGTFSVNFEQTDFNKQVADSKGLNLKFTALNDWTPSELAITTGYAPRTSSNKNIPGLDYMLIHREGKNLDTLFTSVLQPYKGEEYIESMSYVAASVKSGTP
ncbi:MAG: Ig-like domain-containing protein, partial [Oscillospiraceae bacterium]|nr:Ig-like domain-containing protein [Oscillospiraceae bacterium]